MATTTSDLNRGIAAARAGRNDEAQRYLTVVLRGDPNNIAALFWLAFVTPAPQDSVRLLQRVLQLDPTNERAKAGLRWAQTRLDAATVEATPPSRPKSAQEPVRTDRAASSTSPITPSPSQPQKAPQPAPTTPRSIKPIKLKKAVAPTIPSRPQARTAETPAASAENKPTPKRSSRSRLALTLLIGALTVVALILGAVVVMPPETLAAWWPAAEESVSPLTTSANNINFVEVTPTLVSAVASPKLASETDTIVEVPANSSLLNEPSGEGLAEIDISPEPAPEREEIPANVVSNLSLAETTYAAVDPTTFVGPELPAVESAPVENLLLAHQPASPDEKWIEVNVSTQQITAWEGTKPVFSFIGSTGLPNTPTVLGKYNIYWKLEATLMAGPDYYLPEVPYTMYFYAGYALHGAYWHNNFGQPMSHGCVNLDPGDAKTLFEWADPVIPPGQTQVVASAANPGTLVVVHD